MTNRRWRLWGASLTALCAAARVVAAAEPSTPPGGLTLAQAVDLADTNYPVLKAALQTKVAAASNVDVARAAYFPRVDLLWQINRATINNTTGLLLPQSVIPSISGPVLPESSKTAWNEAGGVLADLTVLDFGVRGAKVEAARAGAAAAGETYELTRLQVMDATVNAYLNVVAAQSLAQAAQANVDRLHAFSDAVHVLVTNKLRAGVEGEQADAAESLGRTQLVAAQASLESQRATLAKLAGRPPEQLALADPTVTREPVAPTNAGAGVTDQHPAAQVEAARVREQTAQLKALDRSFAPRVDVIAGASGRGSGKTASGAFLGGGAGLNLDTGNWAIGAQVTLPLGAYPALRAQHSAQRANVEAERARYQQTLLDLAEQRRKAEAGLTAAQAIAKLTPVALNAARNAEAQQRARYRSGLASTVDVTAAEAALAQAETQDAVARINLWRAWADLSSAAGDFTPFRAMLAAR